MALHTLHSSFDQERWRGGNAQSAGADGKSFAHIDAATKCVGTGISQFRERPAGVLAASHDQFELMLRNQQLVEAILPVEGRAFAPRHGYLPSRFAVAVAGTR